MVYSGIPTKYPEGGGFSKTRFDAGHPVWNPHSFEGWADGDFVPKLVATAQRERSFRHVEHVSTRQGIETAQRLAREEGIFCGISGKDSVAYACNSQCFHGLGAMHILI